MDRKHGRRKAPILVTDVRRIGLAADLASGITATVAVCTMIVKMLAFLNDLADNLIIG